MIVTVLEAVEDQRGLRVGHRFAGFVGQQVLFRDIGGVNALLVLGQQVIEGLILLRTDLLGDRAPPFVGVGELGIDVEDNAAERENPVADDLAYAKFCESSVHNVPMIHGSSDWNMNARVQTPFTGSAFAFRDALARVGGKNGAAGAASVRSADV